MSKVPNANEIVVGQLKSATDQPIELSYTNGNLLAAVTASFAGPTAYSVIYGGW